MIAFLLTTKLGRGLSVVAILALAFMGFKIWLAAHDASIVREEAAKCTARIENMVSQSEADALAAVLAREQAKRAAAEAMATEERNRAAAAIRAKEEQDAKLAAMIKEASENPGLTSPNEEDLKWLERSR